MQAGIDPTSIWDRSVIDTGSVCGRSLIDHRSIWNRHRVDECRHLVGDDFGKEKMSDVELIGGRWEVDLGVDFF